MIFLLTNSPRFISSWTNTMIRKTLQNKSAYQKVKKMHRVCLRKLIYYNRSSDFHSALNTERFQSSSPKANGREQYVSVVVANVR